MMPIPITPVQHALQANQPQTNNLYHQTSNFYSLFNQSNQIFITKKDSKPKIVIHTTTKATLMYYYSNQHQKQTINSIGALNYKPALLGRNMFIYTKIKMANNTKINHSTSPQTQTKQPQTSYTYPLLIIMAFIHRQRSNPTLTETKQCDYHAPFDQSNPKLIAEM